MLPETKSKFLPHHHAHCPNSYIHLPCMYFKQVTGYAGENRGQSQTVFFDLHRFAHLTISIHHCSQSLCNPGPIGTKISPFP